MTQKERSAKSYRNRKDNGLCPRCGRPLDRDGYYCSECLDKTNKYRRDNRKFFAENNICTACGKEKVPNGEKICPECRAKIANRKHITDEQRLKYNRRVRENQNLLYKERAEAGICTRCGKRKAATGKKKCEICLAKDAELHRKRTANRVDIRKLREENRLCYFCGEPIDLPYGKSCSVCRKRFKKLADGVTHDNKYWRQDNKIIFGGNDNERS